ncbi:MAG TPA: SDR family oxidoreductase [Spirochaetota bacterium]|nr:SDR family oxidoreductase [Spirochaetota bacterium]
MISQKGTAVITGATSGIGAEFARRFAAEGYDLIITGRKKIIIKELADTLTRQYGISVTVLIAELSKPLDLEKVVKKIKSTKSITVLVNNAGFGTNGLFHENEVTVQEQMLAVHALAPVKLTHAAIPHMIAGGKGIIINVSSISAKLIFPSSSMYSGTKAFLQFFTETLHLELKEHNIKVQALCPGFTRSKFHEKMGIGKIVGKNTAFMRWMTPEQVVDRSLKALTRGKVLYVPGFLNKMSFKLPDLLPRWLYYRILGTMKGMDELVK